MLIISPKLFFTVLPGCPNQPRIDFSYYKYVPRLICLLICGCSHAKNHPYFIYPNVHCTSHFSSVPYHKEKKQKNWHFSHNSFKSRLKSLSIFWCCHRSITLCLGCRTFFKTYWHNLHTYIFSLGMLISEVIRNIVLKEIVQMSIFPQKLITKLSVT